ncbi:Sensor histidine kinase YpdA [Lacticaseibacillus paracasei]|nr:Sensor histidine kinase YpdA [Lacticaseibacillus paracasei]
MGHSFRSELVKEIRRRFSALAVLLALLLVGVLSGLVFFIQSYQVTADMRTVSRDFNLLASRSQQVLSNLNKRAVPNYLESRDNERVLYQQFYEQSARLSVQPSLLILNAQTQPIFQSDLILNRISLNYVQTVIKRNRPANAFMKVTKGENDQHFLLFFARVPATAGNQYSVLVLNGAAFSGENIKYGSTFTIADNYDNVFATNSTSFILPGFGKMDSEKFAGHFYVNNDDVFLMRRQQLGKNIFLYTFLRSFPLMMLIVFGLVSVASLLGFLIWQANRAANAIGDKTNAAITELVNETSEIREGKQKRIQITTNDEFQYLADSINAMVERQEAMTTQQLQLQKQTNQYELKMLEAQFNPHFLYNTLENIRITIKLDPALAEKLILSLNRVLRYSIDHSGEPTTLEADLDVLEDFLMVNQVRFDKLRYQIAMDPSLANMPVPRLFLLPLIENALKYGMKTRSDLMIVVTCEQLENAVTFTVIDNGGGFSSEKLISDLPPVESETHHGLANSFRRLQMLYPTANMQLSNTDDGGAKVTLHVARA